MGTPLRLLLVEDSEDDALLLQIALRRSGYQLVCERVDTAWAMRSALTNSDWDLIISDHAMPAFSAPEALALAKELRPDTPLMIVSGEIDLNLAVSLVKNGAQDYIQKRELARLPGAIERVMQAVAERREREKMSLALRASEARFQTLVNSMDDILFTLDREGRHSGLYGRWVEQEGFTPEMFLGKTQSEVLGEENGAAHEEAFRRAIQGERVIYGWSITRPGQPTRYLETSLSPIWDGGQVTGLVGVGRDLTSQRRAEVEERRRQAEYRTLVENAPDMIFRLDSSFRYLYANPAMEKELGFRLEDRLGKTPRELDLSPAVADYIESIILSIFQSRQEVKFELDLRSPKGIQHYLCRGVPEMNEKDEVLSALFILRNVTEQQYTLEALEERVRFETLLTNLSTFFLHERGLGTQKLVENGLRQVMEYLGADRGSLYELLENGDLLVKYAYAAPGAPPPLPLLPVSQFPWYTRQINRGLPIWYSSADPPIEGAEIETEFCRKAGIHFVVAVPLVEDDTLAGALAFLSFHKARSVPRYESFAARIRLIGDIFLNLIRRNQAEDERNRFYHFSPDLLCTAGMDGYYKQLNPAWEKALGWTAAELMARPYIEFVHPADRKATLEVAAGLARGGDLGTAHDLGLAHHLGEGQDFRTVHYDNRYLAKDGSYHRLSWTVFGVEGRTIYAMARDDSSNNRVKAALDAVESEVLAGSSGEIFETMARALTRVFGSDCTYIGEINTARNSICTLAVCLDGQMRENFEYALAGTPCERLANRQVTYIQRGAAEQFPGDALLRQWGIEGYLGIPLSDVLGGTRGVLITLYRQPIQNAEFLIPVMHVYSARITAELERRIAERELAQSEARYLSLFRTMLSGLALCELISDEAGKPVDFRFLEINPAFETITGLPAGSLVGRTARELRPDPNIGESWVERMSRVALTGLPEQFEEYIPALNKFHEGVIYRPAPGQCAILVNDITEQRRADEEVHRLNSGLEERVRESTRQLEAVNKELEAFSYSVSHDLRAPLRRIDGYTQALIEDFGLQLEKILNAGPDPSDAEAASAASAATAAAATAAAEAAAAARDYLERIHNSVTRMSDLIDSLLNLARLSHSALHIQRVDLSQLARSIASELSQREPERVVEWSIEDGLEAQADEALMRAVLENLIGNAWKFTLWSEPGRIALGAKPSGQAGGKPVFFVRDNGAGFDMAQAANLFTPFHRLHSEQEYPGSGIGLATVQRVINRHGGQIWAESAPGQGATFYFTL